ncbi:hypothetical protein KNP414_07444 [Paenibacillus mucilaginosus KNP414]|uniref:Uncharacterized protein n=1 Tax=Paenibacillus mucilaginosus (strain KNP414) TaxID=1036673 RepID=F8F7D9_PAEMK|nr:hypothetical protein KNP414_07444 [Paenibacillus mucilaginosus KNP414]
MGLFLSLRASKKCAKPLARGRRAFYVCDFIHCCAFYAGLHKEGGAEGSAGLVCNLLVPGQRDAPGADGRIRMQRR